MKNIVYITLIALFVVSCQSIKKDERVLVKGDGDAVLVLETPKARCHKCQKIIEDGLQNMRGVQQSILDLSTKKISIVYAAEQTSPEVIEATVNSLTEKIPCK